MHVWYQIFPTNSLKIELLFMTISWELTASIDALFLVWISTMPTSLLGDNGVPADQLA